MTQHDVFHWCSQSPHSLGFAIALALVDIVTASAGSVLWPVLRIRSTFCPLSCEFLECDPELAFEIASFAAGEATCEATGCQVCVRDLTTT